MFSFLISVDESAINRLLGGDSIYKSHFPCSINDCVFEIAFLQKILKHINRLLDDIDDNALTYLIKHHISKIACNLVHATNDKLYGAIDYISKRITGKYLNDLEETILVKECCINDYTMDVTAPCLPNIVLSQLGGIQASCGLHAVMHMLLSMGFKSNFFDFREVAYQRAFAQGFNRLNNGEICTMMSEINDVLRSFADTLAAFTPLSRLYSSIGTKGLNDYNFCDLLKPSIKANFGLKKSINAMNIKESVLYDIKQLTPEWLLFDIGTWCCFTEGINIEIIIYENRYRLHSFIANTGFHYVCCVLDTINTASGTVNRVHVYDDLSPDSTRIEPLSAFTLDSIGALAFHKM